MSLPIFHSGKVHVMKRMCQSCVFGPNSLELEEGRLVEVIRQNLDNDAGLPCHSTAYGLHGLGDQVAVCKGFFDRYSRDVTPLRAARILDVIAQVEPFDSNVRRNGSPT